MSRIFNKYIPADLPLEETSMEEPEHEEKVEEKPVKNTLRQNYETLKMGDMVKKEVPEQPQSESETDDDDDMSKSIYYMVKGIRMMMKRLKDGDE
jgi:hypothetical protein